MSDPADPILSDIAKAGGGLGGGLLIAFVAWLKGESNRKDERGEIREALEALRKSFEEMRVIVLRSDKDLALIAHTLGEKSARNDRLEKRQDDMERDLSEMREELAGIRGYNSGIKKAP